MLKVIATRESEAPKMDENKAKALQAALTQIERQFGKGAIMRMGDKDVEKGIEVVSTGSLGLDLALGVGGLPRGRVVEIYGPESSGKTTLTLQVIANIQKLGGTAAFIDAEHALDPQYAQRLGVDTSELLLSQPDNGEQALEIADMLVRSASVDCVVVDSVAALTPKAEIEGEMGEPQMGLQARLMSQALRKLTANIKRSNTLVIFINQIRMKIGVMFGNPETTTGGNALKFYASVRMDIRRIGSIKRGEEVIGNETRVKVVKNKVAPPSRSRTSTSSTTRASPATARSSSWACSTASSTRAAPGTPTRARRSARARTTRANSSGRTRRCPTRSSRRSARRSASPAACPSPRKSPTRPRRTDRGFRAPLGTGHVPRLHRASPEAALRARALRLLARREHSRAELRRKLAPHVEEGVDLEALLDDFTKRGWLSEERFVEQTVRAKARKFGPLKIAHHLREKGIDEAGIAQGLAQARAARPRRSRPALAVAIRAGAGGCRRKGAPGPLPPGAGLRAGIDHEAPARPRGPARNPEARAFERRGTLDGRECLSRQPGTRLAAGAARSRISTGEDE